jgi:hypothetical protein
VAFADPPTVPPAPAEVVVSRREATVVAAAQDRPMVLVKAGRREDALMRLAVFATTAVTVARPRDEADAARDVYRWTHRAFLQRQLCVTSITGQFACGTAQSEPLEDGETGSAPADPAAPEVFAAAEAASSRLVARLRSRADALFASDRRLRLEPMLKAAGVTIVPGGQAPAARANKVP